MPLNTSKSAQFPVPSAEEVLPVVMSAKEVVFADLETTGFGKFNDITEIGAVRVDIETGKVLGTFSTLCHLKIQKKVPAKITEITQITTEMLHDAPNIEQVLAEFRKFIGESPVSFHNAVFDWTMLGLKYETLGIRLANDVICTRKLFHYLHPGEADNLENMTTFYGRTIEGHHRAYVDCKWAAACYRKMRQEVIERFADDQPFLNRPPQKVSPIHEISYEELVETCQVYRISGWKKGKISRIYCSTNLADCYYDLNEHVWNVSMKKTAYNLNINAMASFILNKVGMDLAQFRATYAA